MKTKKFLALLLSAAMVVSMVGCGGKKKDAEKPADNKPVDTQTTVDDQKTDKPVVVLPTDASLDFEDGSLSFAGYLKNFVGGTGAADLSVAEFNGSKALKLAYAGKNPCVAFDLGALLGDKVADVASIEFTIGTDTGATFSACTGVYQLSGVDGAKWSVYVESGNPKRYTMTVPEGVVLANGDAFAISLGEAVAGVANVTVYIDNIAFKDAAGNIIAADTAAEFALTGAASGLPELAGAVDIGFTAKAGGWSQAGVAWAGIAEYFKPGMTIEVEYACKDADGKDSPIWFVFNGLTDENGEGWGWVRCSSEDDGWLIPGASYAAGKVQIPYEALAAYWGDGFETRFADGAELQGEGQYDWEIFAISIGKVSNMPVLADAVDMGFSAKAGGWSQSGKAFADVAEFFKPGTTLEIEYACKDADGNDCPIWFVFNGLTDENGEGWGWVRCSSEDDGWLIPGATYGSGIMQVPYEALAAYWGDGFETRFADGAELQGEGQYDWEIYSIAVGVAPLVPFENAEDIAFSAKAAGWSQAGKAWADIASYIAPGCILEIEYACKDADGNDCPIWFVFNGLTDENGEGWGWVRCSSEDDGWLIPGAKYAEGIMQVPYSALAAYWGDGFETRFADGAELQGEGQYDWEIYSIAVVK